MTMSQKIFKNGGQQIFTGISAEHYVAAEISRRHAISTITAKNTPVYDVIASDVDGRKKAIIQVKAGLYDNKGDFLLGNNALPAYTKDAFHVFVLLKDDANPEYWIVPSRVVAHIAEAKHKSSSLKSPRHFPWKLLRSVEFRKKYYNNWSSLGIFST